MWWWTFSFLFLDKHDVEESCTVYSLIFMLEMLKKKGEDHTYCYAFSFEYHLLHFKTFKSLLHWRKIIKCRQLSFSTSQRRCLNSNVILHFCANVMSCPERAVFVSRAKNKKSINQLQIDAVTDVNDNGCLTDRSMHWRYRT